MSETWAAFAADPDAAPDLVATWALIETCGEASPALALRLIAHHLASPWAIGPWPRALDPLLAVPGVSELWRASPARDAIGLGLAMMGHLDAAEVAPAMVDAYVAAIAAAIDPSADADGDDSAGRAIALACADGARLDAAFGARILAAIAPDARLPVALVAWLARGERDAVARVRLELRAADLDGPRPAIAPADRATLAAILDDPAALGDDDALAAGAAARALDLALPVATWDGLARAAHLARTEDLDEPAIEVVRALRRASPARRAQL
ncbi:MAG: hypothetical protein K8W52_37240, partial [Deltaproteobacteria bacterium]|nr:hypothetical protein [Deltaproteobacteria bacterium]